MTKHLLGLQSVDCSETVSKLGNRAPLCEGVTMEKPQVLSGRYLHRLEAGKVGANSLVPADSSTPHTCDATFVKVFFTYCCNTPSLNPSGRIIYLYT